MGHQGGPAAARPPVSGQDESTDAAGRQRRGAHAARTAPTARAAARASRPAGRGLRTLALSNWPVAQRLFAVIALAAAMGIILGGLQVVNAAGRASQFGRVTQLARLGQQALLLASALEEERAQSAIVLARADGDGSRLPQGLSKWYGPATSDGMPSAQGITGQAVAGFERLAASIGSGYPATVQSRLAAVQSNVIESLVGVRSQVQRSGTPAPDGGQLEVIADYSSAIITLFQLTDTIAQGTGDSELTNEVLSLGSLDRAVDQASQQRAILGALLTSYARYPSQYVNADQSLKPLAMQDVPPVLQQLATSETQQTGYLQSFSASGTTAENDALNAIVQEPWPYSYMQDIEQYVGGNQTPDLTGIGSLPQSVGSQLPAGMGVGISPASAPEDWNLTSAGVVAQYTAIQSRVAQTIVDRGVALQHDAERSAWETAVLTSAVLVLVLLAALLVARSLVRPLRRLRAGALEVASVGLPERVRQLSEAAEPETTLDVEPISVLSIDEIGQVARAFDLVHREAVRLAGNEAMLRGSLNAMFVSLSRRSQTLIERLSRMIDGLEQDEDDPDRLSSLFAMDHMITRMRRNSENLLVLAGHEGARKRVDPELLGDVVRAATSEIEQYGRVVINIQAGIEVSGQAATDIVHLLAEIIENSTLYSPRSTEVFVTGQELATGGVLIEVADSGVGISESRMEALNWRLEHPPVVDVSVSRHMGLFAVSHLAARHGIAVRLRPASSSQGTVAMVWVPDTIAKRATIGYGERLRRLGAGHTSVPASNPPPAHPTAAYAALKRGAPELAAAGTATRAPGHSGTQGIIDGHDSTGAQGGAGTQQPMTGRSQMAAQPASHWFQAKRPSVVQGGTSGRQPQVPVDRPAQRQDQPIRRASQQWAADPQWHPGIVAPEPVSGGTTGAGLPLRVPQANRLPGGQEPAAPAGARLAEAGTIPLAAPSVVPRAGVPEVTVSLPKRSPDAARSRLAGLQHGTRRAEARDPRAGEGMDR